MKYYEDIINEVIVETVSDESDVAQLEDAMKDYIRCNNALRQNISSGQRNAILELRKTLAEHIKAHVTTLI